MRDPRLPACHSTSRWLVAQGARCPTGRWPWSGHLAWPTERRSEFVWRPAESIVSGEFPTDLPQSWAARIGSRSRLRFQWRGAIVRGLRKRLTKPPGWAPTGSRARGPRKRNLPGSLLPREPVQPARNDGWKRRPPVSYTHLTLPTNREV